MKIKRSGGKPGIVIESPGLKAGAFLVPWPFVKDVRECTPLSVIGFIGCHRVWPLFRLATFHIRFAWLGIGMETDSPAWYRLGETLLRLESRWSA